MRVLGIETSCDETGVAIYDEENGLLAERLYSQIDLHKAYGGVIPELASRDHVVRLLPMIDDVMTEVGLTGKDIDAIAYTEGPGLAGALMVGAATAKTLALAWQIPTMGIHHMEGHLLAPMLEDRPPDFPLVALLVSGGHTQLIHVKAVGDYELLGDTLDDAAGEAFDKTAKLLGLDYPGGPAIAALAVKGKVNRFSFPRPMTNRPGLDFSFSGLKTHTLTTANAMDHLSDQDKADIAAGFEAAVVDTLSIKCKRALKQTGCQRLLIAGGVSANQALRVSLEKMVKQQGAELFYARPALCTDNGAMIAYAGFCRLSGAHQTGDLTITVRPRWPMNELPTITQGRHD